MTDQELYNKIESSEDATETTNETVNETTQDISEETKSPEQNVGQVENKDTTINPVPPVDGTVNTAEPEKTYSQSEYDKMVFSLKRQIAKNNEKWNKKFEEFNKQYGSGKFESLEKRLGSLEHPEKPLMRDQFQTDDEYIQNLIDKGVEKRWQEREEKMREEYAKYEQQQREEYEHRKELDEGINKWYPSAEERQKFVSTVQNAFSEGLSDLLEQEQNVLNYLHQTENSSRILYEFATKPEVVEQIFSVKNPLMRLMAVRDLENKLIAEKSNPAPVQSPAPTPAPAQTNEQPAPVNNLAKAVGKPGTQVDAEPDIFDNRDSLRAFIRSH